MTIKDICAIEEEDTRRGKLIAEVLQLKKDKKEKDRYRTEWGTKTPLGLYRIMKRIVEEGK